MTLIYDMNRTLEGWNLEENILSVMTLKDQTQGPCRSGTAKFGLLRVGSFEPFGRTCSALTLILLCAETRDLECRRISKRIKPSIKSQRPPRSRKTKTSWNTLARSVVGRSCMERQPISSRKSIDLHIREKLSDGRWVGAILWLDRHCRETHFPKQKD